MYKFYTSVAVAGAMLALGTVGALANESDQAGPAANLQAARMDLSKGRYNVAIEKTERAETGLLNRQSAGDKNVDGALDHVEKADNDLKAKDKQGAMSELQSAEAALNGQ